MSPPSWPRYPSPVMLCSVPALLSQPQHHRTFRANSQWKLNIQTMVSIIAKEQLHLHTGNSLQINYIHPDAWIFHPSIVKGRKETEFHNFLQNNSALSYYLWTEEGTKYLYYWLQRTSWIISNLRVSCVVALSEHFLYSTQALLTSLNTWILFKQA